MNDILKTAITYPCILGVLVVVHEWGHFIVARLFKIRVDEFSIGFGPRALRIGKRGDTEYNIRWIPLGGYVKIAGMEPDEEPFINARDKAKEILNRRANEADSLISKTPLLAENLPNVDETAEQRIEDEVDGFYSKPLWQRSLVIFAGPFMSFVFGYLLLCTMGTIVGDQYPGTQVAAVTPGSVAQAIGLKPNDRIVKIDNVQLHSGLQMERIIYNSGHKRLQLTIERGTQTIVISGTPKVQKNSGTDEPIFGFLPSLYYVHEGIRTSFHNGNDTTKKILLALYQMVRKHSLRDFGAHTTGPVGIAVITYQAVKMGFPDVYFLAAQISISLAIFNLLPIPILDGGHLLMFAVEATRRGRRLTVQQTQNYLLAGLAIIGLLFISILINDISRHIHH